MKVRRNLYVVIAIIAALVVTALCVPVFACQHKEVNTTTVKEATCTQEGQEDVVCVKCNKVLGSQVLPAKGHSFGEGVVEEEPGPNKNGIEVFVCKICGEKERREFECPHDKTDTFVVQEPTCGEAGREVAVCQKCNAEVKSRSLDPLPHEVTYTTVTKEPTCYETGIEAVICEECGNTVEEHTLDLLECSFGGWVYTRYATPFACGERYRECAVCGKKETENYALAMEENSIYIPGTGINNHVAISYFTQEAVNGNDIVYTENAYSQKDENNPFVLGHDYGTLKNLHETQVGQNIYLYVNGKMETYEVIVSEYAVEDYAGTQIVGQTTGTNIWDTFSSSINFNYASYGKAHGGKDLWETENDGKTLHMYTCHKGEPHQPSDGRRGRWIVLAVLVENA